MWYNNKCANYPQLALLSTLLNTQGISMSGACQIFYEVLTKGNYLIPYLPRSACKAAISSQYSRQVKS